MTANSVLTTNFNVDPYYDDYSDDKNFHRVLFKPGFPVQARELTQLQTILQDQVSRFGFNAFKEGSEVAGGGQFIDNSIVVRLEPSFGGSDITSTDFENQYVRTRDSEKLFFVKKTVPATGSENDILHLQFIRYANTGAVSNTALFPVAGEILDFSANNTLTNGVFSGANTGTAQLISNTSAVANGVLFHADEAIYFTKGFFVKTPKQTVSVSTAPNEVKSIGYTITEQLVDSNDDETLLDPARGSFNFTAPGADRFKLTLTLTAKDVDNISAPTLPDDNYFEITRVSNGRIVRKTPAPNYNILGDVLAERTFDESGHYIVNGLTVTVSNTAANSSLLSVDVTPGKSYVKGREVQTFTTQTIQMLKARDTEAVTEQNMTALYGNYVFANNITTGLFDITDKVDLHANTVTTPADKVGEAYIKNIEYFSGSGNDRIYKIFLYDVKLTDSTLTFDTVKSLVSPNTSSATATADIHSTSRTTVDKVGSSTSACNEIVLTNTTGVRKGQLVENATHLPERTVVTSVLFDTVTLSANALLSNTSTTFTFSSTDLQETAFNKAYFELPNKNVTNVTNVDYKFKRKFATVTFTSGVATIQTNGGTERFSSGTGSLANENYFVVVKTGGTGSLSNGENVDLTTGSRSVSTPTPTPGSPASAVIDLDEAGFNGTCDIIAAIDVTGDSRRVKTFANNQTKTFDPMIANTKYSLGFADVIRVNAIYEGNSTVVTSNDTVVTSNFNFDNGQRDNFYDHATIKLKTGQANTTGKILVDFDKFNSSGGKGFFVADSYPNYNIIPTFRNKDGQVVQLRDVIDFRPIRSSNTSSNTFISLNKSFEDHQIVDSQTFEVELDYEYYLKKVNKLILDENGNFTIKNGKSRLNNPPEPADDPEEMTLATFRLNPFTYDESDMEVKINNNARYTMRDIGEIDRRVEKIENITSLNALENQINNRNFIDENGDTLFKNGFLVDSFRGHGIGDVFNSDYDVAIDRAAGVLHAPFDLDSAPLFISNNSATITGDFVTVPFTEEPYLTQNTVSSTINVNPFQVSTFIGQAKLDPDTDFWVDFETAPIVVVNEEGNLDHLRNLQAQEGTEWGNWRVTSNKVQGNFRVVTSERTGTVKTVESNEILQSSSTRKIGDVFYYFMRSRRVNFTLTGMRPSSEIFTFMNGINIQRYTAPSTVSANTAEDVRYLTNDQRSIITDENGSASGFFFVPNDSNITRRSNTIFSDTGNVNGINIPVGTVPVLFTDNNLNTLRASTYALTEYTAEGRKVTNQTTKVMTKEYRLVTDTLEDEKTTSTRIQRPAPVVIEDNDPVIIVNPPDEVTTPITSCPHPDMMILMADRSLKRAGDLEVGDIVRTQHEDTLEWGDYTVSHVSLVSSELIKTTFFNQKNEIKTIITSPSHKFYVEGKGWTELTEINLGDEVSNFIVKEIESVGSDNVVRITVDEAHTYICEGLLSHNKLPPFILDGTPFFGDSEATYQEAIDNVGYDDSIWPGTQQDIADNITAFYNQELGRKPDQGGFEYWVQDLKDRQERIQAEGFSEAEAATRAINETTATMANAAKENGEISQAHCRQLGGRDPLAQTFFIDEIFNPEGIFITSLDLFFSSKDETLPVRIEIRPTVNGFPSSERAIPLSSVSKNPSEVSIATGNNLTPTKFTFESPIHLPPGEYAIIVLTDSFEYEVFRSVIGEQRLGGTEFITEQPSLGSLFKSQNARTWTPAQNEDLCFVLNKASFTTGSIFTTTLTANNEGRVSYNESSNTVAKFDIAHVVLPEYSSRNSVDISYSISTKADGGSLSSFVGILPNEDIFFDTPREITADNDLRIRLSMRTRNADISPYFDKSSAAITLVKNRINSAADIASDPETSATGGGAIARYITRKVTLAEGFDATALKVFLDQNMPSGASVKVFYKVINNNDDTPFDERPYVEMTRVQSDNVINEELNDFSEFEYRAEGITYTEDGAEFNSFGQFVIKVVLLSTSTAKSPTIRNLRAIAFA